MVFYPTAIEKMGRPENPGSPKHHRSPSRWSSTKAMSRAALSRSRLEKARVAPPPPPAPPVSADIIPGRFTEADWTSFVELEEGEDVVGEILDSLMQDVLDKCFKVYLARQRIPFTISQARDAMIKIAEWRFLVRDEGEPGITTDCICDWREDEEPVACITDSWAHGSVPVIHTGLTPRPEDHQVPFDEPGTNLAQEETVINTVSSEEYFPEEPMPASPEQEPVRDDISKEKVLKPKLSDTEKKVKSLCKSQKLLHQPAPPPKHEKPRREYRPHRGPLRSAGLKSITKSLEDTEKEMLLQQLSQTLPKEDVEGLANVKLLPTSFHNILKIQLNRPTNSKDVVYNEFGGVTSVPKLDPARLPRHRIKPHVEVVDLHKEEEHHLRQVFRNRGPAVALNALRSNITNTGKESRRRKLDLAQSVDLVQNVSFELISHSSTMTKPIVTSKIFNTMEENDEEQTFFNKPPDIKPLDIKGPISLKAGVVLEAMKLSPGVIVREPDGRDHSSWRLPYHGKDDRLNEEELRPIRSTVPFPKVTVDQLLKDHVPRVRHIASLPPFTPSLRGQS